ncbi:hypothetical protein KL921_002096 [Ogataea angusta]|nr:hypothetical protein KL921_002096 [Ogataea angusta]
MTLSSHINSDELEGKILETKSPANKLVNKYISAKKEFHNARAEEEPASKIVSKFRGISEKYRIQENGMEPRQAYEILHDELTLDGTTTLNLASFVNTHMETEAEQLIIENLTKNLADNDEYPMLLEMQQRCISILANMWNAPVDLKNGALGTACTGSSEAIMLGGLAMKKNWQAKRKAAGKDYHHPNILMASCCQVALEKFARYFDVEARIIPVSNTDFLLDYELVRRNLDENTIGVFVILGSTYTGGFESVEQVNDILQEYEDETSHFIPIHVDAASAGFLASFVYPDLVWDFRIPRVVSINTSGHKFGLATAGLGWVVFRSRDWLPEELKFQLQYLGGLEESFTINFSRPGYQVIHQYFNFLHLGQKGYYEIFDNCLTNARILSRFLEETGIFVCISNLHLPNGHTARGAPQEAPSPVSHHAYLSDHKYYNPALPVVSFQLSEEFTKEYPEIPQSLVSSLLRNRKWIIPNYGLPKTSKPDEDKNNEILRVVAKYNLTSQLLDKLMHDIVEVMEVLMKSVTLVRKNVEKLKTGSEETNNDMVYNMLLSIANDGNEKLIKLKNTPPESKHNSFRGPC